MHCTVRNILADKDTQLIGSFNYFSPTPENRRKLAAPPSPPIGWKTSPKSILRFSDSPILLLASRIFREFRPENREIASKPSPFFPLFLILWAFFVIKWKQRSAVRKENRKSMTVLILKMKITIVDAAQPRYLLRSKCGCSFTASSENGRMALIG